MQGDDSLENLRARATCPICKEFYTKPKRLDKCPHVFCLKCIKCHLQANRHVNFPGCPMCRRPISKPLSEINDLEPGRAEEDIVNFVKQYETCGLCRQKENPKLACLECEHFICENCKLCHYTMKPTHVVKSLMPSAIFNRLHTKHMCPNHPEMVLDLLCIICQECLCSYCEKFSHGECQTSCHNDFVEKRFSKGFLREYVEVDKSRKGYLQTNCLSRVVYITDFVKEAKHWLERVKPAIEESLEFYHNYQIEIAGIFNEKEQFNNTHCNNEQIAEIYRDGEIIYAHIQNLLEKATDSEVGKCILLTEHNVLQFFQLRRKHNIRIRPLKITFDSEVICKQVSTGLLREHDGNFAGIFCLANIDAFTKLCYEHLRFKNKQKDRSSAVEETIGNNFLPILHDIICIYEKTDTVTTPNLRPVFLRDILDPYYRSSKKFIGDYSNVYENNNIFTDTFIEITTHTSKLKDICNIRTSDIGYADVFTNPYFYNRIEPRFFIGRNETETPYMIVDVTANLFNVIIATSFTNILVAPSLFDINGGYIQNTRARRMDESCLVCFIGTKDSKSGFVTTLIYCQFDSSLGRSCTYGTCLINKIAKFDNWSPDDSEEHCVLKSVKNKSRSFSFSSIHKKGSNSFKASYRSITTETSFPKHYLRHFNIKEKSETVIPVTFENASLFCCIKKGLFLTKYDKKLDELAIGKLSFSSERMETDVILRLKGADVGAPVSKLKPLTMVENRVNDIVVVCAVEDDKSNTFVMVWPYKEPNSRVELLEVQYSSTVLSNATVVDLEMDPDGNIMYVLENQEGESQSVCTKYYMPK